MFSGNLYLETLGHIHFKATELGLSGIQILQEMPLATVLENDIIQEAKTQLSEYFKLSRQSFNIPLDLSGFTKFQQKVWAEVERIPYGQTRSYKDIAIALGDVHATRAIGNANGKNPIPIIIPCHRVIGSQGQMQGYAYGIDIKKWLLALEAPASRAVQKKLF